MYIYQSSIEMSRSFVPHLFIYFIDLQGTCKRFTIPVNTNDAVIHQSIAVDEAPF